MSTKFIVTVDTEEDNQWKWRAPQPFTFENIYQLDKFQNFCEKYKVLPTYLVTSSVAEDNRCRVVLRSFGSDMCEIGAHMHPWSNPPYDEKREDDQTNRQQLFPSQLTPENFEAKLAYLTQSIKDNLGTQPRSFRAGKWGWADWMAPIICNYGYTTDSSVTPGINWQRIVKSPLEGVPNFSHYSLQPYKYDSGVLEIPMTVVRTGKYYGGDSFANWVAKQHRSFAVGAYEKYLSKPLWCRIYKKSSFEDLLTVIEIAEHLNLKYLQFMIHSSELIPGGSPYAKTEEDVERIYKLLAKLYTYVLCKGLEPITLQACYSVAFENK